MVSVKEKARKTCQVRVGKTSASEPLMKRRKAKVMSKPGSADCPGRSVGETCLLPARHPAFRRRESDIRLVHGTWEPVVSMQREKSKWRPHKDQSTNARHRGGTARSSDEGGVMRLERRGRVTYVSPRGSTAKAGGIRGWSNNSSRYRGRWGDRSRVSGDVHARFWESPGVRFPRATHHKSPRAICTARILLYKSPGRSVQLASRRGGVLYNSLSDGAAPWWPKAGFA